MEEILIPTNEYQTPITKELLDGLNDEVREQFLDYINNVPYIQSLISPDRKRAKDLPRDNKGRIIVDLANPHILEDMDYFRETILHFKQYGVYTQLRPNPNPNSEFGKWFLREVDRCINGMVRPSDGEWITGDMYYYLNYCPMLINVEVEGTKIANRIQDFPKVWEGIYLRYHYLHQARYGGLYNEFQGGNHAAELARRGAGKSYTLAQIMAKRLVVGEISPKDTRLATALTGYTREYLSDKDGTFTKYIPMIDHATEHTQFYTSRLKDSPNDMIWISGYKDSELNTRKGPQNVVMGVAIKDEIDKLRGKRARILVEEFGCHIKGTEVLMYDGSTKKVENVELGDLLMGDDNTKREVLHLHSGIDDLYKITLSNGDYHIVNSNHIVYFRKYDWHTKKYEPLKLKAKDLFNIKNIGKGYYIPKATIEFKESPVNIDPYFLGLWLGDGDSTRLDIANGDYEVLEWLSNNFNGYIRDLNQSEKCKIFHISKKDKYDAYFKDLNLYNNKHVPSLYKLNSPNVQLNLIAGLIDSDGFYHKDKNYFEITQHYSRKDILEDIKFMCECNGLRCSISTKISSGKSKGTLHYRLRISGDLTTIPTKINRKKGTINNSYRSRLNWTDYTFKIEKYGKGEFYGFTVDSNHLFLLKDLTITHNSFPNLLQVYGTLRPSVEEGSSVFEMIYLLGTSGSKDSDFEGAKELMYHPDGYNIYSLPNVYDKVGQALKNFCYFFPGYVNRIGHYNKDGVSDVVGAIIEILNERYKIKYKAADPNAIIRAIAEIPITPQEAILKTKGNIFPTTDLNQRIAQIDMDTSFYNSVYTGSLVFNRDNKVEFFPSDSVPIRDFPHKDNKIEGAWEIYEMPELGSNGKPFPNRYIASYDPYDSDQADTMSLGCILVMDLWTDTIVAERTGRTSTVDEMHEEFRKATIFYNCRGLYENNKKGTYAYFAKMNSLFKLEDTPEYLRDKQIIKAVGIGNSAKGVNASNAVNVFARTLIQKWLLQPRETIEIVDNEQVVQSVPNLYSIKNRALLKELSSWNADFNFDRVSSLGILMLYRESIMILTQNNPQYNSEEIERDYLGADPFFSKNYRKN